MEYFALLHLMCVKENKNNILCQSLPPCLLCIEDNSLFDIFLNIILLSSSSCPEQQATKKGMSPRMVHINVGAS